MSRTKEVERTHFTPREYQIELLERAIDHNSIVALGTGQGKTFIAVLLLKHYTLHLLRDKKKAIFIVDKVALVDQQALQITTHTTLKVWKMSGAYNFNIEDFSKNAEEHEVLVLTAQIFLDALNHAFFELARTALIIFDECHHALGKNHPYRKISNKLLRLPKTSRPRILGLTASIINKKVSPGQLEVKMDELERALGAKIESASDVIAAAKYGARPHEIVVKCTLKRELSYAIIFEFLNHIKVHVETTQDFVPEFDIDPRKPILEAVNRTWYILEHLGPWCAWKVSNIWQRKFKKFAQDQMNQDKQKNLLLAAETTFRAIASILTKRVGKIISIQTLLPQISEKAAELLGILSTYHPKEREKNGIKDQLCGIIFVEQRYTAYILNTLIKQVAKWEPELFDFIKSDFVVGHTGTYNDCEETRAAHKRQEKVLSQFRKNDLNLLVATSVLEEGVDVRQCNVVIRYDKPSDFRSYVQSRGRARRENGLYFMLVEEGEEADNMISDLRNYHQIEKMMLKRYRSLADPSIDDFLDFDVDDRYPPYVVEGTGAQVMMTTAIQLVNRYCAKLPSDIFTRLVPQINPQRIQLQNGAILWNAELILPINSPVKEVIRLKQPMSKKSEALMAVALEACKLLHQRKELNDNLLPVGKDIVANLLQELDEDEFGPNLPSKAGSAKKRRLYEKKLTKALYRIFPGAGELYHVYIIDMKLVKPITEESNPKKRRIVDPADVETTFGFFSERPLPAIPGFPVFMRHGMAEVKIKLAMTHFILEPKILEVVKLFHQHVFEDVLHLNSDGSTQFSIEHAPVSLLIAPFKKIIDESGIEYELDWSCLADTIRDNPMIPTKEERKHFRFDPQRFYDRVVTPWYRDGPKIYYYVAEICQSLTPDSDFPDDKFTTFNHYFKEKYDIEIYDQSQPLLDVDHTSCRMNLLMPRLVSTKNAKRFADPSQRQILVPELIHVHPLSASLWHMLIALPTILYRMNTLLLADELRSTVLQEALDGTENIVVPDGFEWDMLTYPTATEDKSTQIKNLDQLKRVNAAEILEQEQKDEGIDDEDALDSQAEISGNSGRSFSIGVWNPDDAAEFAMPKPVPMEESERDEALAESIGMGATGLVNNISDDEEDEDEMVFYDFKSTYNKNRLDVNPRPDLTYNMGWEEPLSTSATTFCNTTDAFPISFLDAGNGINMASFMQDIQSQLNPNVEPVRKSAQRSTAHKSIFLDSYQALDDSEKRLKPVEKVIGLVEFERQLNQLELGKPVDASATSTPPESRPETPTPMNEADLIDTLGTTNRDFVVESAMDLTLPKITVPEFSLHFSFDEDLLAKSGRTTSCGVSPSLLLQALTTSNAADGMNLERLETVGDSFLKLSATNYLYHNHTDQHEGKLSFARSKEVSNVHLYKLGRRKGIPSIMVASKFEPQSTWLPPCYVPTSGFTGRSDLLDDDEGIDEVAAEASSQGTANGLPDSEKKPKETTGWDAADSDNPQYKIADGVETIILPNKKPAESDIAPLPYNYMTQQLISDKSIADCVEALIGSHLISLGPKPTLKFMKWLGLKVITDKVDLSKNPPLLRFCETESVKPERVLADLYLQNSLQKVEATIGYHFKDKAYLVQAFTHASYYKNRVTGCYQRYDVIDANNSFRLEFLGDAVLDYLITRFLFEHKKQYSPGVLTDLRSALVNNTIFASLAIKYNFHRHFIHYCPPLYHMITKYEKLLADKQILGGANFNDEMYYLSTEEEIDDEGQEEDVEVPKALGDIFESVAGAIYLDCGMRLDTVWRVFYNLMRETIDWCCLNPPQSPVRELFEFKNYNVRFTKLERILETNKIRVTVDVNNGTFRFTGMGRSYRIAKSTAAKRALKFLKKLEEEKGIRSQVKSS